MKRDIVAIVMSEIAYKVILVGSSGVGKTSLVQHLTDHTFSEQLQSTVGVEFRTWIARNPSGNDVKLNIWDTAGQERFRSVSKAYFRNAVGAILVFAIDSESSFIDLDAWLADLHQAANPNAVILLVGNKCDLQSRQISETQAREYCLRHEMEYLEASAKEGTNVEDAFVRLAGKIADKATRGEITVQAGPRPEAMSLQPPKQKEQPAGKPCQC
jgi:small GTP-binding protein